MAIRFGTDGWRAVISEDFTFENVRHVAQAIADYVAETNGIGTPHASRRRLRYTFSVRPLCHHRRGCVGWQRPSGVSEQG